MRRKICGDVMIEFSLAGEPIAWKRARPNHQNKCMYDPQKVEKERVKWQLRHHFRNDVIHGPVRIAFKFHFPVPDSTSGVRKRDMINNVIHHIKKPDGDNLVKFYLDCMTGIVFDDDCQVCNFSSEKFYAEFPSVYICIEPLNYNFAKQKESNENDPGDD